MVEVRDESQKFFFAGLAKPGRSDVEVVRPGSLMRSVVQDAAAPGEALVIIAAVEVENDDLPSREAGMD